TRRLLRLDLSIYCLASKPVICPPIRVVRALASNAVMGLIPERPWLRPSQKDAAPTPIDDVTPMPVMTTRREGTAIKHLYSSRGPRRSGVSHVGQAGSCAAAMVF